MTSDQGRNVGWPAFDPVPRVAFIDVDGTLLAATTTYLFARILRRRGLIKRSFVLRAMYHGLQHRFGRLDYGRLVAFGLRSIARVPVVELERIAYDNFVEHVRPRLYEGVVEHLNGLRRSGTEIVLVSSSPGIVIAPLSLYLGCTDTVTTPVRIEKGRIVGTGDGPACYGEGKLYWARRWAQERQISMDDVVAYADNWSDRALLERVGRAVVVHPRGKLARLARRRGWAVVRPRRPGRARRTSAPRGNPDVTG
jgi:HAD superfamily hydrolase (TIGR01490 family)